MLQVTIRAGKVLVAGTVPTEEVQQAVAEVVAETVPGLEVHNHTTVASFPEGEEVDGLAFVRSEDVSDCSCHGSVSFR